jgi:signal transduction histidine kinase
MTAPDLIDRLAQHRTLGKAPREELAWLAAHGYLRHVENGDPLSRKGELLDTLIIVLSGHFAIYVDRGLGPRKVLEWSAGDVSGYLPYSRMVTTPGDTVIDTAADLFFVHRDHFPEMIRECPNVTAILVHVMLDRARRFTSSDLQDEKMLSLGKLSAGLAHELNNPASAAARSAKLLIEGLARLEAASRDLGAAQLTDTSRTAIDRARTACEGAMPSALSPIERADREEAIATWLDSHAADAAADALVDTGMRLEDLDALASALDQDTLSTVLRWIAADCATRALVSDIEKATTRIQNLVAAVKRFTYMDRAATPEPIDLASSINDSVALLLHKARRKSVAVSINVEPDLPRVLAIGGDLNQVWTNLIDNAIDAVPEAGRITITAGRQADYVIVHVIDDGPGIPQDIRERIFDPFVTTKPVGQGTGLGLDIARRLVRRNNGDIEVESRPGRTEFRVTLPVAAAAASRAPA